MNLIGYVTANKTWIFSGIGVPALLGAIVLLRRVMSTRFGKSQPVDQAPQPVDPANMPDIVKTEVPVSMQKMRYVSGKKRIKNGDYYLFPTFSTYSRQTCVTLKAIEKHKTLGPRARLRFNDSMGLMGCGSFVEEDAEGEFLMPFRDGGKEEDYSVFNFDTSPLYFEFFRLFISHINLHAGEIEIDFVQARSDLET